METAQKPPSWRWGTLLLVGLSLSIGWGIRGNFGHEYGAAFAGCLAAITVCLLSGREDWRARLPYFAFFGALGWGFGGSISYMQVISYTESGHALSQWYGYVGLFYIGFLWAALGGAGTALSAVADKNRLVNFFPPLLFIFGAWFLLDLIEDPVAGMLQSGLAFDDTWQRHKSPLYWFDADYLPAFFTLFGVGMYDLYQRKGERNRWFFPLFAAGGALAGWGMQQVLRTTGLEQKLAAALTYPLGDPDYIDPATGQLAFDPDNFLNNWPQWFGDYPDHVGWFMGAMLGITIYFILFGKFRNGSSLFVYMAGGWVLCFLAFPVLGSVFFADYGGIRLTPPRADDWAGITGVFIGMALWMFRQRMWPVVLAAVVSGTIGGLGFSGMQWVKQLMMALGNPRILTAQGIYPESNEFIAITSAWANWQSQNWHSFLEQSYGFVNGLAIAVALGILAPRLKIQPVTGQESTPSLYGNWTRIFAFLIVLLGLPYVNLFKNVEEWGKRLNPEVWFSEKIHADGTTEMVRAVWDVPYIGHLPGMDFLHMTPEGWFNITWLLFAGAFLILAIRHYRQPLSAVPKTALGKGQLIYLILLWVMVIGNFERALPGWTPIRLLTEWSIFVNAVIATLLVLILPAEKESMKIQTPTSFQPLLKRAAMFAIGAVLVSGLFFMATNRLVYGYPKYEKLDLDRFHSRFGSKASWRAKPNLKNELHQ